MKIRYISLFEIIPLAFYLFGITNFPKTDEKYLWYAIPIAIVLIYIIITIFFAFQRRFNFIPMHYLNYIALILICSGSFGLITSFISSELIVYKLFSSALFSQVLIKGIDEYFQSKQFKKSMMDSTMGRST